MRFSARIFGFLLAFLFVLFVSKASFAQNIPQQTSQQPQYLSTNTNPDVPNNLHNWTQNVLFDVMSAMSCQITGIDPTNPSQKCLGIDKQTGKIGFVENGGGAITVVGSMITMLYTPPLHSTDYVAYLSSNFGISKSSYAAGRTGSGFDQLSPLTNLWIAFRNIAYVLFIIVFLVIGVAIMLRVRIDPRTVMTIQNQIPKIVIGLILVTFSFAIAGFLIDLMWASMYVVYSVVAGVPGAVLGGLDPVSLQSKSPLDAVGAFNILGPSGGTGVSGIANMTSISLKTALQNTLGVQGCPDPLSCLNNLFNPINFIFNPAEFNVVNIMFNVISGIAGTSVYFKVAGISSFTTPIIGDLLNAFKGTVLGIAAGAATYAMTEFILREVLPWLIIYLIVYVAILWALLRLWFELIKAYIFILVDVIFAPFWIVAGLFPGATNVGFGPWIRDMAGNLAAFPAAAGMFLVGKVLMDAFANPRPGVQQFVPPLIGHPGNTNLIAAIIGLGFILATPHVVQVTKAAFKAPKIGLGPIGQGLGVGASVIATPFRRTGGALFGKNAMGMKKPGSVWVEERFGAIAGALTGGGLSRSIRDERGREVSRTPLFRSPFPRRGGGTGGTGTGGGGTPPAGGTPPTGGTTP